MSQSASCSCGQLQLTYQGEITRAGICHCLDCQKRTGSVFAVQTRLDKDKVTVQGQATRYTRNGDSGSPNHFYFCPQCGSTVYWECSGLPGSIIAAIGNFADPALPTPSVQVYGNRKHHWVVTPESAVEYFGE